MSLRLVVEFGRPLAVVSAHRPSQSIPTTAQEGQPPAGTPPSWLDGNSGSAEQISTIVDLSTTPPRLQREGALTLEALQQFLPTLTRKDEGGRRKDE
ncbi:MAG: hypothetical protein U0401_08775 [Anaerolineae bacterium]